MPDPPHLPLQSLPSPAPETPLETGEPLRLTMAITELDTGGAEKAFVKIALGLQTAGWEVDVVSLRDRGPLTNVLQAGGIPVAAMNCRGCWDIGALLKLQRHLLERRPRALLTFLHHANLFGRIAAGRAGIATVICGIRVADRRLAIVLPERITAGRVTHYVAVSTSVAITHARLCGIPENRITVIRNAVDVAAIAQAPATSRSELNIPGQDLVILFAGRLVPQKAPLDLLHAFHQLKPELRSRTHLLFVGEGSLRNKISRQSIRFGLQQRVHLAGWRPDLIGIMKISDLLVLPSHWEGLPNVLLEATAVGLPCIAADVDGVREIIQTTNAELHVDLFPAGNQPALTRLLERRLEEKRLVALSGKSSEVLSATCVTWDAVVAEYDGLLRSLCKVNEREDADR